MQRFCRSVEKHEERQVTTLSTLMTIAMVVLLLLSLTLVFVSVARADIEGRNFTKDGGWVTYNGTLATGGYEKETTKIMVFEGEKIYFMNETNVSNDVIITGPYDDDADTKSGCKDYPRVEADAPWDCTEDNYYFKVTEEDDETIGGWFGADDHSFTLELEKEEVQESENFNLTLKKNNKRGGVMKLTIEDSEGYSIMNESGTDIYEIRIEYKNEMEFFNFSQDQEPVGGISIEDNKLVFNVSELDMEEGKYKIILEDYATEVEKKVDIEVEKIYLKVECDEEVIKGEDIVIIIKSSFYEKEVNVTVEGIPKWEDKKTLTLDEEGKKKVKISAENEDCGTYKVTVEVCGYIETKYVKIKKSGTSLEVPENATVGDIVHIEGTSDFGDFTVFLVDDIFKKEARISGDKFEWDWDTSGELDGYREIEVFILSEHATDTFSVGDHVGEDWQRGEGVDASTTIFLLLPEFSMTVSKNIAKGDDVVISGTVIGADHVYVIVMNHKGEVMFPPDGTTDVIKARTTSVEDGKWEENIGELDSGRYTVIAFYEGKDGVTDAINDNDEWEAGDKGKTLEQRVAILEDALTSAGSDDLFERADFSVHAPKVILKEPKTVVEIGDEITVKAETNIREGEKAFISLFQNSSSDILKKTFALVENGSVNASINTSGLLPGKYNIAVDISGRASAEKEITLVEKKEVVEEGKEEIAQNESLTEPGTVEEANESIGIGVGEGEINESYEEEEEERKIPVSVGDLLI
ncbi:MAG: hypothetical protein KAT65_08820, partial [Methanophagales archaeon]|nr:hypothetical protein [Methanophagales archaeon]